MELRALNVKLDTFQQVGIRIPAKHARRDFSQKRGLRCVPSVLQGHFQMCRAQQCALNAQLERNVNQMAALRAICVRKENSRTLRDPPSVKCVYLAI